MPRTTSRRAEIDQATEALLIVGAQLANLAHNLSQPSWPFEERHRDEMHQLYRAWDAALARLRTAQKEAR